MDINWEDKPINVLGVWISNDKEELLELNYRPILTKSKRVLESWKHRSLSLLAKIQVYNALIGSLFVYKMYVLPKLPKAMIIEMDKLCRNFLWGGGIPKISKQIMCANKDSGGLGLIDLEKKESSLKATWPKILQANPKFAVTAYELINSDLQDNIWRCNLKAEHCQLVTKHIFWQDVL